MLPLTLLHAGADKGRPGVMTDGQHRLRAGTRSISYKSLFQGPCDLAAGGRLTWHSFIGEDLSRTKWR